ncbi:methylated-DNA--[protein]-cysteine S-methyltransferase [Myceligenerans salitolerans]|uniref:Methylated-DNA--[protein]-cysteine S-methyltransferase n=1 Tax=Myceligenerans salitolerans TaxID=1230528 RepID=A0ABS3IAS2_9MICO|nr:methylated-DNA--[protein]-cysteine S-methyltransferase [Myceligenerans salitolerans]MBO0609721.1 methylated-DNA--[protein]-cysteine S-methyltransferase [Myceligenerans salitolerans]
MHTTTLATPDGPFTIVTSDDALLASGWTEQAADLLPLIHRDLLPGSGRPAPRSAPPTEAVSPAVTTLPGDARPPSGPSVLAAAAEAVVAYYDGDHRAPGRVPVRQVSGEYRTHAWDVLRDVAPGERLTYTQYAARTGRPAAVRAAAGACAMNAAALFVPCHRVLRTDGTLGGFRYGLAIKESLLARES